MNEEHNMTLIEKWQKNKGPMFVYTETEISDWFLAQFDSMLAEDIEKMKGMKKVQNPNKVLSTEHRAGIDIYNKSIDDTLSVLESRRFLLKK